MPICQYWQRGQCRFGNECRFEHSAGGGGFGGGAAGGGMQGDITTTLVTTVKQDIEQMEKGNQWIFSCYAPAKETSCFPGRIYEIFSHEI